MENDHILTKIINSRMCTGCGSCVAACKNNALEMKININEGIYLPYIKKENCTHCKNCLEVCPALLFDNLEQKKSSTYDIDALGKFEKCYVGYSTDVSVRKNSSSGGLITELTTVLLKEQKISGAILARMDKENPLVAQPFIARCENDVISAAGSKYCPIPMNTIFKDIQKNDNNSYVFVGLPCHINGLRKLREKYKYIDEKVKYSFGLVCNHTPTLNSTKFILKALSIDKNSVSNIRFRGNGWPGNMSIELKNGSRKTVSHFSELYWGFMNAWFFWPLRCTVCQDKICEQVDISFMDAWHSNYSQDNLGTSFMIVRNEKADLLVNEMFINGNIYIEEIDPKIVIKSQNLEKYYDNVNQRRKYLLKTNKEFRTIINGQNIAYDTNNFDYSTRFFYFRNLLSNCFVLWPLLNLLKYLAGIYLNLKKSTKQEAL